MILGNIRAGLTPGAQLAIVERPMDEAGSSCLALAYDMHMMVNNVNGRECIAGEHRALFPAA
jgi:hypothetical protein